jgi:hypothetical protein
MYISNAIVLLIYVTASDDIRRVPAPFSISDLILYCTYIDIDCGPFFTADGIICLQTGTHASIKNFHFLKNTTFMFDSQALQSLKCKK